MKCYVTNVVTSDGYGSKLGRILNLMYFTFYAKEKYNVDIEFLYSPLDYEGFGVKLYGDKEIACYYTSRESYIERAKQWENKLKYNGLKITDVDIKTLKLMYNVNYDTLIEHLISNNYDNRLFVINTLFATLPNSKYNSEIENLFKYKDEVIKKFDMVNPFKNNKINISLHMRRNNVTSTSYLNERWLSDEYYLDIIKIIESKLKKEDYELTIYTQTNNFNVEKFKKYNIVYDQTSEDYDCFMNFVFSDILVLGISSFSLTATYISKNIAINPPTNLWLKQKSWIETKDLEKTIELMSDIHTENLINNLYNNSHKLQTKQEFINIKKLLVLTNDIDGDVVEVGVCQGDSALLIKNFMNNDKKLYLFDTFDGIQDVGEFDGTSLTNNSFVASYDTVKMKFKYKNVRIYKGYFPDCVHIKFGEKKFSFIHLDVDTYQSTKNCLNYFYDRMVVGGIILTHDYTNPSAIGVQKAFDEFFENKKEKIIKLVDSQSMIIKI